MHSTRGGTRDDDTEFSATLNWFSNPAAQVSAHIVIHADGTIAECVDPALEAWHARAENGRQLGIEICQPRLGDAITDEQLRSAAWWLKRMSARFGFPLTASALPEHRETASGRTDGKSDIGAPYSYERLAQFF
jgi:N-acetyl-anhydromuramyl-L-alanine amidase AmpD